MTVKIKEHNLDVIYFPTFAFCRDPTHLSLSHLTFNILVKFTINLTELISRPPSQPAPDPLHLLVQSFDEFRTEKFVVDATELVVSQLIIILQLFHSQLSWVFFIIILDVFHNYPGCFYSYPGCFYNYHG